MRWNGMPMAMWAVFVNHASADYYTMSSFSSWGVPGSLEMKPEITAPGGNIYSLKDGGTYQNMSGTSMAAPQITGMAALVAQYIRENDLTEQTGHRPSAGSVPADVHRRAHGGGLR